MLQYTHQPSPSLRHRLASRLESSLQNMHTPRPAPEPEAMPDISDAGNNLGNDDGWAIFDQRSMELASQNLNLNMILILFVILFVIMSDFSPLREERPQTEKMTRNRST